MSRRREDEEAREVAGKWDINILFHYSLYAVETSVSVFHVIILIPTIHCYFGSYRCSFLIAAKLDIVYSLATVSSCIVH